MRKFLGTILIAYLLLSAAATIAYSAFPKAAWEIARHRNGLLIFDEDTHGVWLLNPFNNYGDDWIWVVEYDGCTCEDCI